jgi:hypothetical protein
MRCGFRALDVSRAGGGALSRLVWLVIGAEPTLRAHCVPAWGPAGRAWWRVSRLALHFIVKTPTGDEDYR